MKLSFRSPRAAKQIISEALRDDARASTRGDLAERARELKAVGKATDAVILVEQETGMNSADAGKFVESLGK
jgi:hypothetical protein